MSDGGSALGVGSSVLGGVMSKNSADKAGENMQKANQLTQAQIAEAKREQNAAYAPYTKTGSAANSKLAHLLGLDPYYGYSKAAPTRDQAKAKWDKDYFATGGGDYAGTKYQASADSNIDAYLADMTRKWQVGADAYAAQHPENQQGDLLRSFSQNDLNNDVVYNTGLQFGLDEGTKGINRLASANGGIDSGATLKALTRYANDYGTTKAEGAYGRFDNDRKNTYSMLGGQQAMGLNATNNNQSLNNNLLTQSINSNQSAASDQANANMAGTESLIAGINGGVGNYLYSNRAKQTGSVTGKDGGYGGYNNSANNIYNKNWYA